MFKKKSIGVCIRLESSHFIPNLQNLRSSSFSPLREAFNLSLNIHSSTCISLKKKKKIMLTILSSPHVNKKAREQYQIDKFISKFFISTETLEDYKKFLEFKTTLYLLHFDQGFDISFFHARRDRIKINLSYD